MIKTMVEGSFIAQVFRGGIEIIKTVRQKNLILETKMQDSTNLGGVLHVGTGNTTPAYNDTGLVSVLTSAAGAGWVASTSVLTASDYEKEVSNVFTFSLGAVVGNLAELGVSPSNNPLISFHTRALFKDGVGNPTVLTVTAQDQLVVTYFVKKTSSMLTTTSVVSADVGGTPTDIDYTIRPCISSQGDGGSGAVNPSSIYGFNPVMIVNSVNIISVDPVTFIPTSLNTSTENAVGSSAIVLTATGNEVTHTFTFPISSGNLQWVSATLGNTTSTSVLVVILQIEFNGPNYITKINTETVTFQVKEIVDQVV